ncbi:MAG: HAD family hydrolase [Sphingobacterium sp.]
MKLIIFDLDGTLINTLEDLANSGNYALAKYNLPTHAGAQYKHFIGNGIDKLIERILPIEERNREKIALVKETFIAHYNKHAQDTTQVYPGILELLTYLRENNFKISVATNKYHDAALTLVTKYFPTVDFDLVLGHRENFPAKPDPAIVEQTLQTLAIKKENCYYLGDSDVDMLTAGRAGVKAIGVTWGFRSEQELRESGADFIINSPQELHKIIK